VIAPSARAGSAGSNAADISKSKPMVRYRMLETIRQYARERLRDAGEMEMMQTKIAHGFLDWVQTREATLCGPAQTACLDEIELEVDNIRAVLRWAEVHDSKRYLRIVRALWRFWDLRGLLAEGYAQLGQAIAITNQAANEDVVFAEDRVLASATAAFMARNLEDYRQAALLAEQTIQAVNSRANPSIPPSITLQRALSIGYFVKGAAHLELNQPAAALRFLSDARALFEETHDYGFAGTTWVFFGFEAEQRNDLNAARECMERGLALTRKSGDGRRIAHALVRLGFVALAAGDADHAQRFFEETYALAQAIRDRSYLSNCKFLMGRAALFRDDFAYAASLLNDPLLT
jgi:tetratricopeptide (TPR) repeat protein